MSTLETFHVFGTFSSDSCTKYTIIDTFGLIVLESINLLYTLSIFCLIDL